MSEELHVDNEAIQKEKEQRESRRGGFDFNKYEIEPGTNEIRLMPRSTLIFREKESQFAERYYVHYKMFPNTKGYKMLVCPQTVNQTCAVCDYLDSIKKDKDLRKKHGKIRQQERCLYNVIDLKDMQFKVMETGPQVHDEILKHWADSDWGPAKMVGLDTGCVVKIEMTPKEKTKSGWNEYEVVMTPRAVPLSEGLPDDWKEILDSLVDKIPPAVPSDEMAQLLELYLQGKTPADSRAEEVRETEAERAAASSGRKINLPGQQVKVSAPAQQSEKTEATMEAPASSAKEKTEESAPAANSGSGKPATPEEAMELTAEPKCFGSDVFKVRDPICKACAFRDACKAEFLKSLS